MVLVALRSYRIDVREDASCAELHIPECYVLTDSDPVPVVLRKGRRTFHNEIRTELGGGHRLFDVAIQIGHRCLVEQHIAGGIVQGALQCMNRNIKYI